MDGTTHLTSRGREVFPTKMWVHPDWAEKARELVIEMKGCEIVLEECKTDALWGVLVEYRIREP